MNILIVEDEFPAADRLASLLHSYKSDLRILGIVDSVEATIEWLQQNAEPDLMFMDIQLADGLSFEIFEYINIDIPVIFTTAFDQYAIKAFDVNSIDYLLKPISKEAMTKAMAKFSKWHQLSAQKPDLQQLIQQLSPTSYRNRFMIKIGEQYKLVPTQEISYFMADSGLVFLITNQNRRIPIDYKLEELEQMLRPTDFFRLNRKFIAHIQAISKIHTYFNSRLKIELQPATQKEVIISRERVQEFKQWMNS